MIKYTSIVLWIGIALGLLLVARQLDDKKIINRDYYNGFKDGCKFMQQQMEATND